MRRLNCPRLIDPRDWSPKLAKCLHNRAVSAPVKPRTLHLADQSVSAISKHPEPLACIFSFRSSKNGFSHDRVRLIAAAIAKMVVDRRPDIATVDLLIRDRNGRVYLDFGQNGRGRTMACVYSSRAQEGARVSTPLRWEELRQPIDPGVFTMTTIFKRLDRFGDLFKAIASDRQDITPFCEALRS